MSSQDSLYDPDVEAAEEAAIANAVPVPLIKDGTKEWRQGPMTFDSFDAFTVWRKDKQSFKWLQSGHAKRKVKIDGKDQYVWYSFVCKSHCNCKASVSSLIILYYCFRLIN